MFAERHGPIAVAGAPEAAVADHHRVHVALGTVTHGEEISQRRVDARRLVAVVVHTKTDQPRPRKLVLSNRDPDVRDHAGASDVCDLESFTWHDALAVVVALDKTIARSGSRDRI